MIGKGIWMLAVGFLLVVALVSCGASALPTTYGEAAREAPMPAAIAGDSGANAAPEGRAYDTSTLPEDRMIIWTAELSLTVEDAQQVLDQVNALARSLGGYPTAAETWLDQEQLHARTTIRVPAERFDEAMAGLRGFAIKVDREVANSQDVTEEYVDLQSRLRHLEAKESQLLEFLDKAEDTEAVLAVYEQLSQTQMEIEQVSGRMTYLQKLSAMATISVELHPEPAEAPVIEEGWKPGRTLRDAARALVRTLQNVGEGLIWIGTFVLPMLLILVLPVLLVVFWVRRRRRRRSTPAA